MVSYSHTSLVPDRLMQPVGQTSTVVVASHHFLSILTSKGLVHELVSHGQISRYYSGRELFDNDDTEHFELGESFQHSGYAGRTSASVRGGVAFQWNEMKFSVNIQYSTLI